MNNREQYKKFAQKSTIRNSEYDRLNTNATRHSNPIGQGQNFLPGEIKNKKAINNMELVLRIVSVVIGVGAFFLIAFLGKIIMGNKLDDSLVFLFLVLVSSYLCYSGCFALAKKHFL